MKTKSVFLYITIFILFPFCLKSQNNYVIIQNQIPVPSTMLKEYLQNTYTKPFIGLGIDQPNARFQIYDTTRSPRSLFKLERFDINTFRADSILFLGYFQNKLFGITQKGNTGAMNYLQGNTAIGALPSDTFKLKVGGNIGCTSSLDLIGPLTGFNIFGADPFPFTYRKSQGSLQTQPLLIYKNRIRVNDTLQCKNIRIDYNANNGFVLLSDQHGNGIWTNPAGFADKYWMLNYQDNMYSNPAFKRVGILTREPLSQFQVNDGASKISIGSVNDESFRYGNGYVGFNAARVLQDGNSPYWLFDQNKNGTTNPNGGGVLWSGMDGSFYIATIPSSGDPEMRGGSKGPVSFSDLEIFRQAKIVIAPQGNVGIG